MISAGTIPMGDTFDPIAGTLPSGILSYDAIDTTAGSGRQAFTSRVEHSWEDTPFKFTNQGQKWERDYRIMPSLPTFIFSSYGGVKQVSTPRRFTTGAVRFAGETTVDMFMPHVMEFEFVFTGQKLTFEFLNIGGNGSSGGVLNPDSVDYGSDCQVYVEYGGRMWRAADKPKTTTDVSGNRVYRNMTFSEPYHGRIRFRGSGGFMLLSTEASAVVSPAPPRPFIILDGDSYVESAQALTADSVTQWFTTGIADMIYERTGYAIARRGQGGTGFFTNGTGLTYDDAVASITDSVKTYKGPSRTLSANRWRWMTDAEGFKASLTTKSVPQAPFVNYPGEDFGQPLGRRPLAYILNGTWNDASVGGVDKATMKARAKECYQLVRNYDPECVFIHIMPEPFDDTMFGNAVGPPRVGDKSDIHRQAQTEAASEVARTYIVNGFGPDPETRWWTGYGPQGPVPGPQGAQGVPTNSQQAQLVSRNDGIHYTYEGGRYFAEKACDGMAKVPLSLDRVNGTK